jgi:hypothetical protein
MLCSAILDLHVHSKEGRERELKVNLEEIWSSGALFLTDVPIRPATSLWFAGGGCEFRGQVITPTLLRGLGYFIEMRFHPSCIWSEQKYRPKHLFNPLVLLANRIFEGTPDAPNTPPSRRSGMRWSACYAAAVTRLAVPRVGRLRRSVGCTTR